MKIVVQKFGGTSVSTSERRTRAIDHIQSALNEGYSVVVVVSAMGRQGDPYATDTLLSLVKKGSQGPGKRDLDLLMACGEIISAVIMVDALRVRGISAVAMTGRTSGIVTDDRFGDARILEVNPEIVLNHLRSGRVCVVAGFQGATASGETTTLGRGGSDTTAAALGVALHAEVVEIYTDVDGVMTADPRIVRGARTLQFLSYREVGDMAHLGAKVIHPRAIEIAMAGRVPLLIKSTLTDGPGTLISDFPGKGVEILGDRVVTGITHLPGLGQIRVGGGADLRHQHLAVFRAVADVGISVDMINVSPEQISFAVAEEHLDRAREVLQGLGLAVEATGGFAKVSAVGAGMRGVPGVMARVVSALARGNVSIYQTADSHTSISCLVKAERLSDAVSTLHEEFGLGMSEESNGGVVS